jgi:ankyrin repeat protein
MTEGRLPDRPHPDWYRKAAKARLHTLRETSPDAKLADAQRDVAREHGFPSWRKLIAEVGKRFAAASSKDFFDAIRRDDYDRIRALLEAVPGLVDARTESGETALHVAAEINNPETIRILVAHGGDPKARYGSSAHSALSWAVTTMAFEAAEELVRSGVRPDLFCAAGLGELETVRAYFDATGKVKSGASQTGSSRFGPDGNRLPCPPNTAREVVSDALYIACRNGRAEVVRDLLSREVDLTFRGYLGASLLHWAHFGGSNEVIAMLTAAGADPSARDDGHGYTPRAFGICVPASWGLVGIVIQKLKADPTLALIREGRGGPLHEAAREGHETIVRILLACGADPKAPNDEGKMPLDLAREGGHEGTCALLGG